MRYGKYAFLNDSGYSFMKLERDDGQPMESVKSIDWKYLVALLNYPVRKKPLIKPN